MDIEPGIYFDVPCDEYRRWPAFAQSGIKHVLRSPKHYMAYVLGEADAKSKAMILGSLIDCLVLEPLLFSKYFAMQPATYESKKDGVKPWNANSLTCKKIKHDIEDSGKQIITEIDFQKAKQIAEAVNTHVSASEIIAKTKKQVSLVWQDSDTGVLCKGRLDMMCDEHLDDLKSTMDACPAGFSRSIESFGYHIQGAFYSDGYAALTGNVQLPYNIIAAETESPFCVATYALEPDTLLIGRAIYKKALKKYKECKDLNNWPGYSDFIEPIDVPPWAIKKGLEDANQEGF
jgi:exodeoxyribonuclease VIII